MEVFTSSPKQTQELAQRIAKKLKPKDVIVLIGDLGAGKTFFTTCLTKALGINARVQSPTFVLVREYEDKSAPVIKKIYHADLYRMTNIEEVLDLGLLAFMDEPALTIIEWPELIIDRLPKRTIRINIDTLSEFERKIHVHNLS
jgi:tRNA threonylcarbamoyladenosine biosynthesis protein TsaE